MNQNQELIDAIGKVLGEDFSYSALKELQKASNAVVREEIEGLTLIAYVLEDISLQITNLWDELSMEVNEHKKIASKLQKPLADLNDEMIHKKDLGRIHDKVERLIWAFISI